MNHWKRKNGPLSYIGGKPLDPKDQGFDCICPGEDCCDCFGKPNECSCPKYNEDSEDR